MMNKNILFKKSASLILALFMIISALVVIPFTASAEEANVTIISTPEELLSFIISTRTETHEGETILLANDIDLTGKDFVSPAWSSTTPAAFKGKFDGQGHSIKNVKSTSGEVYFFHSLDGAEVRNLSIVESTVTQGNKIGVLANRGTNGALIRNVYINVNVNTTANFVGGMIGCANGSFTVENCVVASTIVTTSTKTTGLGGFLGQPVDTNKTGVVTFKNCAFLGTIQGTNGWAGFCPLNSNQVSKGLVEVTNCVNMGNMDYTNWAVTQECDLGVKVVNSDNIAGTLVEFEKLDAAWTQTGKTEMMPTSVADMIGKDHYFETDLYYQRATSLNADGTVDVRFITVIDTLDYDQVGFKLQITRTDANKVTTTSNEVTKATTQVFESIIAFGETVTAEELGGKYIVAVVISGINCADYENVINVTAFVQNGEEQTPTATGTVTLATTAVAA